jgi:hypothetical protein
VVPDLEKDRDRTKLLGVAANSGVSLDGWDPLFMSIHFGVNLEEYFERDERPLFLLKAHDFREVRAVGVLDSAGAFEARLECSVSRKDIFVLFSAFEAFCRLPAACCKAGDRPAYIL